MSGRTLSPGIAVMAAACLGVSIWFSGPAEAQTTLTHRLAFGDPELTNCYYRNQYFNKNVRASFALFNALGTAQIDPPSGAYEISRFAIYGATPSDPGISGSSPGNGLVFVNCDDTLYKIPTINSKLPRINLIMKNLPPTSHGVTATFNGKLVEGVPPGSTVVLSANASDKDALVFEWKANEGGIQNTNKGVATWKLPTNRGLHFAYVLITDGRGGYLEDSIGISTDGGVVTATAKGPPIVQPSDFARASDHFLTFYSSLFEAAYDGPGADSKLGSCQYYVSIGAVSGCQPDGTMVGRIVDFTTWKAKWGFAGVGSDVRATYANIADLNLQRDMHGTSTPNGTAFYVCNSPNQPDDPNLFAAIHHQNVVACVAMEYAPPPGSATPIVKFLTFGPGGELFQSVNLDGRGEKFMPGSCVVCHAATNAANYPGRFPESQPANPDLGANFLPFDQDNFAFSKTLGFTKSVQAANIKQLNKLVLNANPPASVAELINGWYPTSNAHFQGKFVPIGWSGDPTFYLDVIKPSCRTCHVANTPAFNTEAQAQGYAFTFAGHVCGSKLNDPERLRYSMPNSPVTFNRFWNNMGGEDLSGLTQSQEMYQFITGQGATITECEPPNY